MKQLLFFLNLLFLSVSLVACGADESAPAATPVTAATDTPIRVVAMGDSLTEGLGVDPDQAYPAQLARKLAADGFNVDVINAGISGETTSGARSRVDWVLSLDPDVVILATGGNDGLRGIDPSLTEDNIDALVQRFQESGAVVVLAGMEMVQNMGEVYTSAFRAIYPDVAARHDVILIPFFLEGVGGDPALNQPDFVHPTAAGYEVVVETIYPYVVEALERVGTGD
ncbi:MAG: arylesterase [Caldilineaceae bacterium]|nr:arylesterase [Caldilineaceae bacterium]